MATRDCASSADMLCVVVGDLEGVSEIVTSMSILLAVHATEVCCNGTDEVSNQIC